MTADIEKPKPCPFCGDPMYVSASMLRHVEPGDCVIGHLGVLADHVDRWNRRAGEAGQ